MEGYYIKKIGHNKGAPRLWFEGTQTARAGFVPGQHYDVVINDQSIVLQANSDGSRIVSGKRVGESNNPVIDLNSQALLAMFDGMAAIRVVVKKGEIHLLPLATELKKRERFERLKGKLERGEPLDMGSLSHGVGVLTHAMHSGLQTAGVQTRVAFANEIRGELLEQAAVHNDAWDENTQVLAAPLQELAFDSRGLAQIPRVEGMELGLPCSGHSSAGKSKRHLVNSESHPEVGHLVVGALVIINRANPAFLTFENVPGYAMSASADILRNQLRDMGYTTHERILNGKMWGALENRDRWCMVAVTEGIHFDFDQLIPPGQSNVKVQDVLDPAITNNDSRWRNFDYLKDKQERDIAKGNGFHMQLVSPADDSVPTIRKGYHKGGSTDPLVRHPTDLNLLRQFTAEEHASIKGVPVELVAGLSNTIAHEALGQGIIYKPFQDVGMLLGQAVQDAFTDRPANRANSSPHVSAELVELGKLAGVDVEEPNTAKGRYSGVIVAAENNSVIQEVSKGSGVVHDVATLSERPKVGTQVNVVYREGKGQAKSRPSKQLDLGL